MQRRKTEDEGTILRMLAEADMDASAKKELEVLRAEHEFKLGEYIGKRKKETTTNNRKNKTKMLYFSFISFLYLFHFFLCSFHSFSFSPVPFSNFILFLS